MNENWGLKLKINFLEKQQKEFRNVKTLEAANDKLRESNELLRSTIEEQDIQIEDLRKVERARHSLEITNEELIRQLAERDRMIAERDQAVDEAGAIICSLEEKLDEVESPSLSTKPKARIEDWLSSTLQVNNNTRSSSTRKVLESNTAGDDDRSTVSAADSYRSDSPDLSPPSIYNASSLFGPSGSIQRLKYGDSLSNNVKPSYPSGFLSSSPSPAKVEPTYQPNTVSPKPPNKLVEPTHHPRNTSGSSPRTSRKHSYTPPAGNFREVTEIPSMRPKNLEPGHRARKSTLSSPRTLRRKSHTMPNTNPPEVFDIIPEPLNNLEPTHQRADSSLTPPRTARKHSHAQPTANLRDVTNAPDPWLNMRRGVDDDNEPCLAGPIFDPHWQNPAEPNTAHFEPPQTQRRSTWVDKMGMGGLGRNTSRKLKMFGRKKEV